MKKIHVLVQMSKMPRQENTATLDKSFSADSLKTKGFFLDKDYEPIAIQQKEFGKSRNSAVLDNQNKNIVSYVMSGYVEDKSALKRLVEAVKEDKYGIGVFSNPYTISFSNSATYPETYQEVATRLMYEDLHRKSMNGSGVHVVIVDEGFNLKFLQNKYPDIGFNEERSLVAPETGGVKAGNISEQESHGTMCAFNICSVASHCTLIDHNVINSVNQEDDSPAAKLLGDVLKSYEKIEQMLKSIASEQSIDLRVVINNSWGVRRKWDPVIIEPIQFRTLDDPMHPFNIKVRELEKLGADIVFSAGNINTETIYGVNSHPQVLCIGSLGQSNDSCVGPGSLETQKPDICTYTEFIGSGLRSPKDEGTSTACAIASGVVAAIRTLYPSSIISPKQLRQIFRDTAQHPNDIDFCYRYGYGLLNVAGILEHLVKFEQRPNRNPMTETESNFKEVVKQEPAVLRALQRVAISANLNPTLDMGTALLLLTVFPMVSFVVKKIALPWLATAADYSELFRARANSWIDKQYSQSNIDRQQAILARDALLRELESIQASDREAWERVVNLLPDSPEGE